MTVGFRVAVEGTTATVVLREPFEAARSVIAPYHENEDGEMATLNVEVEPGLYYAADSAATIEALRRPGAAEPTKVGDAVVATKQTGAQGFYKVWVSDAPIDVAQGRKGASSAAHALHQLHFTTTVMPVGVSSATQKRPSE